MSGPGIEPGEKTMTESVEDRIHRAGNHDKFSRALAKFRENPGKSGAENDLYEELTACGMSPEEADEWVNMEVELGDDGE